MKKYIFPIIIALSALSVSASAAFYSVYGLSKLFSGASLAIIIMASSLEMSKIVIASLLHQYWKTLNFLLKTYLVIALVALMGITSAGVYGFLTNSYQLTSNQSKIVDSQVEIVENKKSYFITGIERTESQISNKSNRISTLSNLRTQQEVRLDSLYNKGWYNSARKTEVLIKEANNDIKSLELEVDSLTSYITSLQDSINIIDIQVLNLNNDNTAAAELGPLKYIAELLDKPMDKVINWFMLLIIFVFDPLAIALVITANFAFDKIRPKEKKLYKQPTKNWIDENQTTKTEKGDVGNPKKKEVPKINTKTNEKEIKNLENERNKVNQSGIIEKRRVETMNKINKEIQRLKKEDEDNQITY
jgi:hypothetical protein